MNIKLSYMFIWMIVIHLNALVAVTELMHIYSDVCIILVALCNCMIETYVQMSDCFFLYMLRQLFISDIYTLSLHVPK